MIDVSRSRPSAAAVSAVVMLLLAAAGYLGGYFFLWSSGRSPMEARPWTPLVYALHAQHDETLRSRWITSTAAGLGVSLGLGLMLLAPRRRSLHGDARFATSREIARAGLFARHGIVLGKLRGRYLTLAGQQGVALAAPPRSGKGVGIVISNLLSWDGSVVCVDIKGENWATTAGYRASLGHQVVRFDPFSESGQTVRWNPLGYVADDPTYRINELQKIAQMLYLDPPGVDPFWTASARSLFLGIALFLFETPGAPRTLGEVLRQGMASDDEGFGRHWRRIVEERAVAGTPLSSQCVQALYDVIDLAPVTASSIRKTFTSRLDLWLNPMLDAATSANDFDFRELRRRRISIYVCVQPDDLHRLRPVMNLFFQQAIGLQTRELPEHNRELKHQVLMMLDEFAALGRIPIIAEAIAYLPGYNVRVVLVVQTPAQLREVYGPDNAETILKSLAARIAFAPKDHADANEISTELGFTTVKARSISRPGWGSGHRAPSINVSEQRRALLLPQEVKALGNDRALILYEGLRPILCEKIRYYRDPILRRRVRPAPFVMPIDISLPARPSSTSERVTTASRPSSTADMQRLDELTADDFAIDFDSIKVTKDEPLSDAALEELVGKFYEAIDSGART